MFDKTKWDKVECQDQGSAGAKATVCSILMLVPWKVN